MCTMGFLTGTVPTHRCTRVLAHNSGFTQSSQDLYIIRRVESWGGATAPYSGPRLGSEGAVLSPHFMYLGQTRSPRSRYSTYRDIRSAEYGGVQSRCSIISLSNSTHVCLRPAEYVEQTKAQCLGSCHTAKEEMHGKRARRFTIM